jgi:hypothetical protein
MIIDIASKIFYKGGMKNDSEKKTKEEDSETKVIIATIK